VSCGPAIESAIAALGDPRVTYANLSQRLVADADANRHWLVGSTMARNEAARRARGRRGEASGRKQEEEDKEEIEVWIDELIEHVEQVVE